VTLDHDALAAREEIRDVTMRYARGVDRLDWDLVRSCYHPDAYDNHGTYRGGVDGFIEYFRHQALHFAGTMHVVSNFLAEVDLAAGSARSETYCLAHHWTPPGEEAYDLVTGARYLDRFERRTGEWRIAHRRCVIDWSHKGPSRQWGLADRFLRGSRDSQDPLYDWPDQEDRSGGHGG
jgi:hypothetical protein